MGKIKVISTVDHVVGLTAPNMNFHRDWNKKGAAILLDEEMLQELLYEPGVSYLFEQGLLYIEDMETKKNLGLEPADAEEPTNIIVLSDKERRQWMVTMPVSEFAEKVKLLSHEQLIAIVEYAIANKLGDFEKSAILKELTGRDVVTAIQLKIKNDEE